MTLRKPLVLISGILQQLPTGDTLEGSGSVKILATDTSGNLQYVQLDNGTIKRIDWATTPPSVSVVQSTDWSNRTNLF